MRHEAEIRWVIDGFTPDTIPMPRLVEYMSELMRLFGEEQGLRFVKLEDNCVAVVNKVVEPSSRGRIERGLRAIGEGRASPTREAAYRRINEMLAEDGTRAHVRSGSAVILRFPGVGWKPDETFTLQGVATVTGYLYHLSEMGSGAINVRVRQQGQHYARCVADRALGLDLRELLFSTVRLTGKGTWVRSAAGVWTVTDLAVTDVTPLRDVSVREAFNELRAVRADWASDPLGRLARLDDGGDGGQ